MQWETSLIAEVFFEILVCTFLFDLLNAIKIASDCLRPGVPQ